MKHARDDYNRIQDPAVNDLSLLPPGSTPIGEDEPVFLLRGQDKLFGSMLIHYRHLAMSCGAEMSLVEAVTQHIEEWNQWQRTHNIKTPDLPEQP